jgi:hypothetical protein
MGGRAGIDMVDMAMEMGATGSENDDGNKVRRTEQFSEGHLIEVLERDLGVTETGSEAGRTGEVMDFVGSTRGP